MQNKRLKAGCLVGVFLIFGTLLGIFCKWVSYEAHNNVVPNDETARYRNTYLGAVVIIGNLAQMIALLFCMGALSAKQYNDQCYWGGFGIFQIISIIFGIATTATYGGMYQKIETGYKISPLLIVEMINAGIVALLVVAVVIYVIGIGCMFIYESCKPERPTTQQHDNAVVWHAAAEEAHPPQPVALQQKQQTNEAELIAIHVNETTNQTIEAIEPPSAQESAHVQETKPELTIVTSF